MIDQVRLTYAALREAGTARPGELTVRSMPGGHRGVYLGLDEARRSHLLIETAIKTAPAAESAALTIGHTRLQIGGTSREFLDVTCEIDALTEVFDHFVIAVIERLPDPSGSPLSIVLEVFEQWRRFLVAGEAPGRDRLAAVFGELLVLLDVILADATRRVDVWVGPFNSRHDLRRGTNAIEVKATRSHTARIVTVHGEDQLKAPDGGQLHLHLVRLEEVPDGGRSVPDLVDQLFAAGAAAGPLYDALSAAGVPPAQFAIASATRFDVRERLTVPVDDETPRIVPASFKGGERPIGVVDIVYRIDLDHVLDRALDEQAYGRVIAGLAEPFPR